MSIDYTVYIGPYVQCKVSKEKVNHEVRVCPNQSCEQSKLNFPPNVSFCPSCGSKVKSKTISKEHDSQHPYDIAREFNEDLNNHYFEEPGYHYFFQNSNIKWKGRKLQFDPEDEEFIQDFAEVSRELEIHTFSQVFKEAIDILIKHYGAGNVAIKWGIANIIN
jgi:hypothetical protein